MIDQHGFEEVFVKPYQKSLYVMIFQLCHDEYMAENIRQIAFEKAWIKRHDLRNLSKAKQWLFSIARNELKNVYRDFGSYHQLGPEILVENEDICGVEDDNGDILDSLIEQETKEELAEHVEALREYYRTVIKSFYLMGYSIQEIATALGFREDRVRQLKKRGLMMLKDMIEGENE